MTLREFIKRLEDESTEEEKDKVLYTLNSYDGKRSEVNGKIELYDIPNGILIHIY